MLYIYIRLHIYFMQIELTLDILIVCYARQLRVHALYQSILDSIVHVDLYDIHLYIRSANDFNPHTSCKLTFII